MGEKRKKIHERTQREKIINTEKRVRDHACTYIHTYLHI